MRFGGIFILIYLVVGVLVAAAKDYLGDISGIMDLVNILLAIVLWPLVLLGVDFNFGGGGKGRDDDKKKGALLATPALLYLRAAISEAARR